MDTHYNDYGYHITSLEASYTDLYDGLPAPTSTEDATTDQQTTGNTPDDSNPVKPAYEQDNFATNSMLTGADYLATAREKWQNDKPGAILLGGAGAGRIAQGGLQAARASVIRSAADTAARAEDLKARADAMYQQAADQHQQAETLYQQADIDQANAASLQQEATQLHTAADNLQANASSLNTQASSLREQANDLQAQASQLDASHPDFARLEAEAVGMERAAGQLESQADNLEQQASQLDIQADGIETQADGFEADADALDARADGINADADALDAQADGIMEGDFKLTDQEADGLNDQSSHLGEVAGAVGAVAEAMNFAQQVVSNTNSAHDRLTNTEKWNRKKRDGEMKRRQTGAVVRGAKMAKTAADVGRFAASTTGSGAATALNGVAGGLGAVVGGVSLYQNNKKRTAASTNKRDMQQMEADFYDADADVSEAARVIAKVNGKKGDRAKLEMTTNAMDVAGGTAMVAGTASVGAGAVAGVAIGSASASIKVGSKLTRLAKHKIREKGSAEKAELFFAIDDILIGAGYSIEHGWEQDEQGWYLIEEAHALLLEHGYEQADIDRYQSLAAEKWDRAAEAADIENATGIKRYLKKAKRAVERAGDTDFTRTQQAKDREYQQVLNTIDECIDREDYDTADRLMAGLGLSEQYIRANFWKEDENGQPYLDRAALRKKLNSKLTKRD